MQLCMRFHKIILDTIAIYWHLLHTVSIKIKPQELPVHVKNETVRTLFYEGSYHELEYKISL